MSRLLFAVAGVAMVAAAVFYFRTAGVERQIAALTADTQSLHTVIAAARAQQQTLDRLRSENHARRAALYQEAAHPAAYAAELTAAAEARRLAVARVSADPDSGVSLSVSGNERETVAFVAERAGAARTPHLVVKELSVTAAATGRAEATLTLAHRRAGDPPLLQPADADALRTAVERWPAASAARIAATLAPPPDSQVPAAAARPDFTEGSATARSGSAEARAPGSDAPAVSHTVASGFPAAATHSNTATLPEFVGITRVNGQARYAFRVDAVVRTIAPGGSAFGWVLEETRPDRFLFRYEGVTYEVLR